MGSSEQPESDNFLAVIDARIGALQTLRDAYLRARSLGAFGQGGDVDMSALSSQVGTFAGGGLSMSNDLPTGALLGKSIPGAVKLYLGAVKKKQTTREITTALREGGVESTAANFENTVTSALHRLKAAGEILQFKDGWALAEFYPANLRSRIEDKAANGRKASKAASKKRAASTDKRPKPKGQKKAAAPRPRTAQKVATAGESIDSRIATYLKAHAGQGFLPSQVGEALRESDPKLVGMAFARLTRFGKVSKDAAGLYRAA